MSDDTRTKAMESLRGEYRRGRVSKLLPEDKRPALAVYLDAAPANDNGHEPDEDDDDEEE